MDNVQTGGENVLDGETTDRDLFGMEKNAGGEM